jgi:hypothetical protein
MFTLEVNGGGGVDNQGWNTRGCIFTSEVNLFALQPEPGKCVPIPIQAPRSSNNHRDLYSNNQ